MDLRTIGMFMQSHTYIHSDVSS